MVQEPSVLLVITALKALSSQFLAQSAPTALVSKVPCLLTARLVMLDGLANTED